MRVSLPRIHRIHLSSAVLAFALFRTCSAQSADTLLAKLSSTAAATQTLRADITLTRHSAGSPDKTATGTVLLKKPNLALIQLTGNDEAVPSQLASDGTTLFTFPKPAIYNRASIDAKATQLNEPWWALPVRNFFTYSFAVFPGVADPGLTTALLPEETVDGTVYRVVAVKGTQPFVYVEKLYIDPANILERTTVDFGPTRFSASLNHLRVNQPIAAADFHFVPPATATLKQEDPTAELLPLGTVLPSFRLPSPQGPPLSLEALRSGKKATLVNFWYVDCAPCRIEFPDFEALYKQLSPQGFQLIAIDKGDEPANVTAYTRRVGLTFPILLGGDDTKTSVFARSKAHSFPVTYLLDANGRIVYRAAGGDIEGLKKALAGLGLKP